MRELIVVTQDVILEGLFRNAISGFHFKTKPRYKEDNNELVVLEITVMTAENVPFLNIVFRNVVLNSSNFAELPEVQRALNLTTSHPLPIVSGLIKSLIEVLTTFNKSVTIVTSNTPGDNNVVKYPKIMFSCSDSNSPGVIEVSIPNLPTLQ